MLVIMDYNFLEKRFLLFGIVLLILIISLMYIVYYFSTNNSGVEIVVSRYNEDLKWLKEYPFNKHPLVVYNKGQNDNYEKLENVKEITNLKNEGRESHTYLYHIIKNYNNLAKVTVFLPGSIDTHQPKIVKSNRLLEEIEKHKDSILLGNIVKDPKEIDYNFTLDSWDSTDTKNKTINNEKQLQNSKIRPFGKWHETYFPNVRNIMTTGFGIFAISREDIRQHPISYYKNLIKELEGCSNPETGHYFERSWYSVFYPYKNAKLIQLDW